MLYVIISVSLFLLGVAVARVGEKVGVLITLIPVFAWFLAFGRMAAAGQIDDAQGDVLLYSLMVGLMAFLTGSKVTEILSSRRGRSHGATPGPTRA